MSTGSQSPHILVLGNEKGGTGKSTLAVHLAAALMAEGRQVRVVDLDHRQQTSARWFANRAAWARRHDAALALPEVVVADGQQALDEAMAAAAANVLIIDTPGRDSDVGRLALARADTIVTPMNDSFIDFDLLGQVDAESFRVTRPSFYAETIWKARQARARTDRASVDWLVLRNRLSTLEARNRRRVGDAMTELARRVGFRVAPGLSERVIYRELFPSGLTLLDLAHLPEATTSHVAARAELRQLIQALALPGLSGAAATGGGGQRPGVEAEAGT